MDHNDQNYFDQMPDEIILYIFRSYVSPLQLVVSLPIVCERWLNIIASDTYTLQRIGIHHMNLCNQVDFFYKPNGLNHLAHCLPKNKNCQGTTVSYCNAFFLCTQFSQIFRHIHTLLISSSLSTYKIEGFTRVNNITTLEFFKLGISSKDLYTLRELSSVYPHVENLLYIDSYMSNHFDTQLLHCGFKSLKRFRFDHHSITHKFFGNLLHIHQNIEEIEFRHFIELDDHWIDILTKYLMIQGRKIKSLRMNGPYFTDNCLDQFMSNNFFLDKSMVSISKNKMNRHFLITLV